MSTSARSRLGRIPTMAINALAAVILILAALFLLPGLAGYDRYVITGGSMSGTFERGSLVFTQEVPVESLRVGDIITYMPPPDSGIRELVTHRIESIDASSTGPVFRTRGDANASSDPWTFQLQSSTQARFAAAVPYGGWVFIALADRQLRMLIIGIPAAVVGLMSLLEAVRTLREPKAYAPTPAGSTAAANSPASSLP